MEPVWQVEDELRDRGEGVYLENECGVYLTSANRGDVDILSVTTPTNKHLHIHLLHTHTHTHTHTQVPSEDQTDHVHVGRERSGHGLPGHHPRGAGDYSPWILGSQSSHYRYKYIISFIVSIYIASLLVEVT